MTKDIFRVRLYFIRHGQSDANHVGVYICGQSISCPLTPLGVKQSNLLAGRWKYENMKFDFFLCSTAVRAKQTADIVLEKLKIDESKLITSDALLELSQGSWEGLIRKECYTDEIKKKMDELNMDFRAPGGESMRMVQDRAVPFLESYIEKAKEQSIQEKREVSLVVFTHANLLRAVLQYYLQSNPKHAYLIEQYNTAITEILFNEHGVSLVKANDSAHLKLPIPESSEK